MSNSQTTKRHRNVTKAIHMSIMKGMSNREIAEELGVTEDTVSRYVNDTPSESVQHVMEQVQKETRSLAVEELKQQLYEAGSRARSAKKPMKVWQDSDGTVYVNEIVNGEGQVVDREPIPADIKMLPDEEVRFYSRKEIRDILDKLIKLTGAAEPEQHEVKLVDAWTESAKDSS